MRPTKLSQHVFLELPPVLSHYLEGARNVWLESEPKEGRLTFLNRIGFFMDFEAAAVERRHLLEFLGWQRARALCFRIGFEQGRRDAARHLNVFQQNVRLALQAGPVFGQLQGRYAADPIRFEYDLDSRTLYREIAFNEGLEGKAHKLVAGSLGECGCWNTTGYLSGHVSEIIGRRVLCLEVECMGKGDARCRVVGRFEPEWGPEADWIREAMKTGAFHEEVAQAELRTAQVQKKARQVQLKLNALTGRLRGELLLNEVVAQSDAMKVVMARAEQVAASEIPVLLVGESGVGRKTLARAIHFAGGRKAGPFEVLDTTGLDSRLILQELAGFAAGAFPGAVRSHAGAIRRAHRGTLYVQGLDSLDQEAQRVLYQVLEKSTVSPMGDSAEEPVSVRLIAATSEEPHDMLSGGRLREDLYYALSVARIDVPTLREREDDVLRMAEAFLREFSELYEREGLVLSKECHQVLRECAWPGNVRQLRNIIEQAVIFAQGDTLTLADLPEEVVLSRAKRGQEELSEDVIRAALRKTKDNRSAAADLLGIGRTTLWRAMRRMNIE
ncbi:MAG TPA: sigma 54-interacting transcriptional regulator [Candidatus Hydrogenedentes bacterium]|nr:sigma 54-interacting transcriptional regulator [Candidatus Hydrogenedentota bacterium]